MLQDRSILCLANPTWEGNYAKTIVELMTVFARHNRVLFVEYAFTYKDVMGALLGKGSAPWKRILGLEKRLRALPVGEGKQVHVLTPPPVWPINFLPHGALYRFLLRWNARIVRKAAQQALRQLNMSDRLLLIDAFTPALGLPNIRAFNETVHLYHCYDEIGAAQWVGRHGAMLEGEYIPQVDAVVTTSQGLYDRKKATARACYYVPNGVNFALFHQGFDPDYHQPRRTAGYIGSIDDRLDYELLQHCFRTLPEITFHFVGRVMYASGEEILQKYDNVVLHGPKSVDQLPDHLKTFGIGLIPFVKNEFTRGIYPLKINEYLAAGIPVAMTSFGQLDDFSTVVTIEDDPDAFARALRDAIETDSSEKRQSRAEVARANSWEARVEALSDVLQQVEEAAHG